MSENGVMVRALLAGVAVLLPLGGWAAVTVDPAARTAATADGRVGAAGLGHLGLVEEPAPTTSVAVTVAPPPTSAPAPTTTRPGPPVKAPASTTTTVVPPSTTTTVPAMPPGNIAPASSWKADAEGVSLRMRMDPVTPVAGQAVRFQLDFTGAISCCHVFVDFGDGGNGWALYDGPACETVPTPGPHSAVVSHIYAEPGAYLAEVRVMDGFCLLPPVPPTDGPVPLHHLEMRACIAVGPGSAATTGCKPPPDTTLLLPPAMRTPPNT